MFSILDQKKVFYTILNHWDAITKYTLKPYDGKIVFFQAEDRFVRSMNTSLGEQWREVALGGIQIYDITGNHNSIMKPPNVEQIANILNDLI